MVLKVPDDWLLYFFYKEYKWSFLVFRCHHLSYHRYEIYIDHILGISLKFDTHSEQTQYHPFANSFLWNRKPNTNLKENISDKFLQVLTVPSLQPKFICWSIINVRKAKNLTLEYQAIFLNFCEEHWPLQKNPWSSSQSPPKSLPSARALSNRTPTLPGFSSNVSRTFPRAPIGAPRLQTVVITH